MNNVKEFFDIRAEKWDSWSKDDSVFIDGLLTQASIKDGGRVLDLGCGTGVLTPFLLKSKASYIFGLDLSAKMIEIAKKKYGESNRLHFKAGDFYEMKWPQFSNIICYNAYPHFLDVHGFAKKAYELLNQGGTLLIAHDASRASIDAHHDAHAQGVSRHLKEVNEEAQSFSVFFKVLKAEETDHSYLILLQRR